MRAWLRARRRWTANERIGWPPSPLSFLPPLLVRVHVPRRNQGAVKFKRWACQMVRWNLQLAGAPLRLRSVGRPPSPRHRVSSSETSTYNQAPFYCGQISVHDYLAVRGLPAPECAGHWQHTHTGILAYTHTTTAIFHLPQRKQEWTMDGYSLVPTNPAIQPTATASAVLGHGTTCYLPPVPCPAIRVGGVSTPFSPPCPALLLPCQSACMHPPIRDA